ncbi:MAG: TldD/PmbA family protein [Fibrobacteria bacterium]|nr:TldD/PmbA family protein [Fibrobacteria bacterium]
MDFSSALDFICKEAKRQGADDFDALAGESNSIGLDLFEGKVKNTEISSSRGIGIRLFKNGCPGYSFTEKFSKEALAQTVKDAVAHTLLTGPLDLDLPEPGVLPELDLELWSNELETVSLEQMKKLGLALEASALAKDKRIANIPYLGVSRSSGYSLICNSHGVRYSVKGNSIFAGLGVVAKDGDSTKMGIYSNSARSIDEFNTTFMAETAVERGISLLGAHSINSGRMPVVLSNRISPQIISMFTSPFYAEVVQKGQSKLEGMLNTQIAGDKITITCNPHIKGYPGSRLFDGEGVVSAPCPVIENGILRNYLYNLESAKKDKRQSTGNASRDYSGQVGTGFSNLVMDKGSSTLDDLLAASPECLYITNLEGSSGCSSISGEISIGVQGYLVKSGKIVHPVDGITVSTNFFTLLKEIDGLSNEYSDTHSSVKVPDILVASMHVAG